MIWAGFLFGILGSFHCVGMCGPIAMALPIGRGAGWQFIAGRLLYNGGRILTYSLLGGLAGLFGKSLQVAGFQQTVSIISGILILALVVLPHFGGLPRAHRGMRSTGARGDPGRLSGGGRVVGGPFVSHVKPR